MYLPAAAVRQTLRFIREHSGPGTGLVFDYMPASNPRINNPNNRLARWGEPWIFGFPGDSAGSLLREAGLTMVSDDTFADLAAKYSSDGGSPSLPTMSEEQRKRKISIARVDPTRQEKRNERP